jgi:hypothetical protein
MVAGEALPSPSTHPNGKRQLFASLRPRLQAEGLARRCREASFGRGHRNTRPSIHALACHCGGIAGEAVASFLGVPNSTVCQDAGPEEIAALNVVRRRGAGLPNFASRLPRCRLRTKVGRCSSESGLRCDCKDRPHPPQTSAGRAPIDCPRPAAICPCHHKSRPQHLQRPGALTASCHCATGCAATTPSCFAMSRPGHARGGGANGEGDTREGPHMLAMHLRPSCLAWQMGDS